MRCFVKLLSGNFLILLIISCGGNDNKTVKVIDPSKYDSALVKVNKTLVKTEDEQISNFIERYKWKMEKTGTGLRYMIYNKGTGVKAEKGKTATINFNVRLITGDMCYSSEESGAKELLLGKSGEISGLEEGLLLLRAGDKARFIIPSHLAFGLLGDENKIPKRATLVYNVELLKIK
jgi:FKBP-type peptidyl-prolyl cis-trans isomerase FkpA